MNQTVQDLINRASMKMVVAPAPSDEQLAQILQAAMSAPDHAALQPWRFKIIRGAAIKKFADFSIDLRQKSDFPLKPNKVELNRIWLSEVPLIIAVACHISYGEKQINENEQMLATGAAVMQILNACYALGYGAFWSTGLATYLDEFQTSLGFDALDYRYMGFLVVGTPKGPIPQKQRPSYTQFVEEWTGPKDIC